MLQISHIIDNDVFKCSVPKHIQIQNVINYLNIENAEIKVLTKHKPYHTVGAYENKIIIVETAAYLCSHGGIDFIITCTKHEKNNISIFIKKMIDYILEHNYETNECILQMMKCYSVCNNARDYHIFGDKSITLCDNNTLQFNLFLIRVSYNDKYETFTVMNARNIHNKINVVDMKHSESLEFSKYIFMFNETKITNFNDMPLSNPRTTYDIRIFDNDEYECVLNFGSYFYYGMNKSKVPISGFDLTFDEFEERKNNYRVNIVVKTLTGKNLDFNVSMLNTVDELKMMICNKEGIPVDQQRIIFSGKSLEDGRILSEYGVMNDSILHLILRLRGGGGSEFINVNQDLKIGKWSDKGPSWRICSSGLNLEGKCRNHNCEAFRHNVIVRKRFEIFDLIKDGNIECPKCHESVKPENFIVSSCLLTIISKEKNKPEKKILKTIGYNPTYPSDGDDIVEYEYLTMKCEEKDYNCVDCPVCLEKINNVIKAGCGHSFCKPCIKKWSKIKNVCPLCVEELHF